MTLIEIAEFTQSNNQESNEIPEDQRQRRDQSQPRQHYSFQELGFGILGESMVSTCVAGGQEGHLPPLEFPESCNFT